MKAIIELLIRQYGNDVYIASNGAVAPGRLFLQLVASKSWQNMERMIPTGGSVLRGQFLFIATVDTPARGSDLIIMGERKYVIRRADTVTFQGEDLFVWGLCVEGGVDDPWAT